jgi:hypothetical protein
VSKITLIGANLANTYYFNMKILSTFKDIIGDFNLKILSTFKDIRGFHSEDIMLHCNLCILNQKMIVHSKELNIQSNAGLTNLIEVVTKAGSTVT